MLPPLLLAPKAEESETSLDRRKMIPICCNFCRLEFPSVDGLMLHLKLKTCLSLAAEEKGAAVVVACPFENCSYRPGRRGMADDGLVRTTSNTSWSQCLAILANHIRAKHTLEATYECAVCGKCLVTPMAHRYHVKQHNNRSKFYCQVRVFTNCRGPYLPTCVSNLDPHSFFPFPLRIRIELSPFQR